MMNSTSYTLVLTPSSTSPSPANANGSVPSQSPVTLHLSSPSPASTVITPKPGIRTTEFWTTLLTTLLAAVVAVGTLFNSRFSLSGVQALIPAIATLAAAGATSWYSQSRSTVKAAATGNAVAGAAG